VGADRGAPLRSEAPMTATPLAVLLVEDSEDDAELVVREIQRAGYAPQWRRVDTEEGLVAALREQAWDVITCDYVMPRFSAPAALACVQRLGVDLPVIIVSGQVGEEVAVTAMKAGAHDYVSKHRLARLVPAIERELREAEARRARRRAEDTLRASEEKYRALIETLNDVVFELDPDGRFTYVSPVIHALGGYRPEELIGAAFADFVHVDDVDAVVAAWMRMLGNAREPAEFRVVAKSRAVRWVRTFSRPIFSGGQLVAVRGVLTDITDRKHVEEAYQAVFEHSLQGLAVWQDGRLELANPALVELTGYSVEEHKQFTALEGAHRLVHPDDRPQVLALTERWLANEPVVSRFEFRLVRKDGGVRRVLTANARFAYRGRPATLVAWSDITERWRAEEALRELNAELEGRVAERTAALEGTARELDAFSYSVSHDLRAPLRSIDGFTQAALEDGAGRLPPACTEHLLRVRRATQRMGELIDQLLTLARAMQGQMQLRPVDLTALAREVTAELAGAEPGRAVRVTIADDLVARGDPALLRTVLSNLIGNAFKFTRNQPEPVIELGRAGDGPGGPYFVRDNGAGFDIAYADRLFTAFQRLHTPDEFEGSGIGLATVRRIVERHGGRAWAEGAPGRGATFYFTLGTTT
jgi:PAS domain S-box-containing protein